MFAVIKIECIGNPRQGIMPAWVKEVIGMGHCGLDEVEIRGQMDYSEANSVASRGAFRRYFLRPGHLYHVSSPVTWKRTQEYYCIVEETGSIIRFTFDEALQWLQNNLWA
jgi:hypothetical protein